MTNNNRGVAGVSWEVDIIPIKVLEDNNSGTYFDIAQGIYYAVDRGADIINLSLGGEEYSNYLEEAVKYAESKGVIMIAATGNYGNNVLYPAAYSETIAVGAIGENIEVADYSNYGAEVDLVAPGTNIYSTSGSYENEVFKYNYLSMSGTSMSAAYVSGIASLLLESGVNSSAIKDRLTSTAVQIDSSNYVGSGLVDAYGALINKKLNTIPVEVFAANIENDKIYIRSEVTELIGMNYNSDYELSNAAEAELYIVAWRDVNNNRLVDPGDYFGVSTEEKLSADYINNIDLNMFYVTKESEVSSLKLDTVKVIKE